MYTRVPPKKAAACMMIMTSETLRGNMYLTTHTFLHVRHFCMQDNDVLDGTESCFVDVRVCSSSISLCHSRWPGSAFILIAQQLGSTATVSKRQDSVLRQHIVIR